MTSQVLAAIATAGGTAAAGWFAWLAKKAQQRAPESVAGGYSKLVDDMRQDQINLRKRIEQLEIKANTDRQLIFGLQQKVGWLLSRVADVDKDEFYSTFKED